MQSLHFITRQTKFHHQINGQLDDLDLKTCNNQKQFNSTKLGNQKHFVTNREAIKFFSIIAQLVTKNLGPHRLGDGKFTIITKILIT